MVLLRLLMMHAISKYYNYSARPNFYKEIDFNRTFKRVEVADFVQVEFFTDGFFHTTFFGICVSKTIRGLSSSILISDRFTLKQRFFIFSPSLRRVVIFSRRLKKVYFLFNFFFSVV